MSTDIQKYRVKPWFQFDGDNSYGLDYDLNADSIVFEIGGYTGVWTEQVVAKFNPHIYVFEPVAQYVEVLKQKFADNPKVKIFPFGLGARDESTAFNIIGDKSSAFKSEGEEVKVEIKDIVEFLEIHQISHIDLMQINIEGGEYELLERLISSGKHLLVENLKVQYHDFVADAEVKMTDLNSKLFQTHFPSYAFKFIWINWQRRQSGAVDSQAEQKLLAQLERYQDFTVETLVQHEATIQDKDNQIKSLYDTIAKINGELNDLHNLEEVRHLDHKVKAAMANLQKITHELTHRFKRPK